MAVSASNINDFIEKLNNIEFKDNKYDMLLEFNNLHLEIRLSVSDLQTVLKYLIMGSYNGKFGDAHFAWCYFLLKGAGNFSVNFDLISEELVDCLKKPLAEYISTESYCPITHEKILNPVSLLYKDGSVSQVEFEKEAITTWLSKPDKACPLTRKEVLEIQGSNKLTMVFIAFIFINQTINKSPDKLIERINSLSANDDVKRFLLDYALFAAAAIGSVEVAELLLTNGARVNQYLQIGPNKGMSPLYAAVIGRRIEIIKLLIKNGASVNQYQQEGSPKGMSLLFGAVKMGQVEIVKLLIENGATVDQCLQEGPNKGMSPLYMALRMDCIKIIKLLIENGATVNQCLQEGPDKGMSPLFIAVRKGRIEIVKLLIEYGATVNQYQQEGPLKGMSPLYIAVRCGRVEIVKLLLTNGACLIDSEIDKIKFENVHPQIKTAINHSNILRNIAEKILKLHIEKLPIKDKSPLFESGEQLVLADLCKEFLKNKDIILQIITLDKIEELTNKLAGSDLTAPAVSQIINEYSELMVQPIIFSSGQSSATSSNNTEDKKDEKIRLRKQ